MQFAKVLRGYDRAEVDRLVARADEALSSGDAAQRAAAREALRSPSFTVVLRGYDRVQVDQALRALRGKLA